MKSPHNLHIIGKNGKPECAVVSSIQTCRERRGMSVKCLAAIVGIHETYLEQIEAMKCKPTQSLLKQIATVLNVGLEEFDRN